MDALEYRCTVPHCQGCTITVHGVRQVELFTFCDHCPTGLTAFQPILPAIVDATALQLLMGEK